MGEYMEDWSKIFYYDETSPSFLRWKIKAAHRVHVGDVAGCLHKNSGYYTVGYHGKSHPCHRIVWELFNESIDDGIQIDHINGVRVDNNISNLRLVTRSQNMQNKGRLSTNTSGVTGVYLHSKSDRWQAGWCNLDGKLKNKSFNINKYGYDLAFQLACEFRDKMILELNSKGSNYTDRHGT